MFKNLENTAKIFGGALADVIFTATGFTLSATANVDENALDEYTAGLTLVGEKKGVLFLFADKNSARAFCSRMTGIEPEKLTEDDLNDAICELANIVAGNVRLRLTDAGEMFLLGVNFLLKGGDLAIFTKKRTKTFTRRFSDGNINIGIKLVY